MREPTQPDSLSDERRIDALCDRFEAEWRTQGQPSLESYLATAAEPLRPALLRELLRLELDYRTRCGDRPSAEEYRLRLPEHATVIDSVFGALAAVTPPVPHLFYTEVGAPRPPLPTDESDPGCPARAGRYVIEGKIARGGMGEVFRATDPDLKRPLAVKVLQERFKDHPELVGRFLEEAQISGQLQHP